MKTAELGPLGQVSRLTLGGGIGQIWGETTHEEALATVHAAVDAGISLIDCAPSYRNAEAFVGEAFGGRPPQGVRFTTKCLLGSPEPGDVADILRSSVDASLSALRLDRVDVFFLHTNIHPDGFEFSHGNEHHGRSATP